MLKKLLLTATLFSSTYGANPAYSGESVNPCSTEVHRQESFCDTLTKIQSSLMNPSASSCQLQEAIAALSTLTRFNRFRCADIREASLNNFTPATFELQTPKIKEFVSLHATVVLRSLVQMLSSPEHYDSKDLFGLFLLAAFYSDLTPDRLDILMSDISLSLMDSWLATSPDMKSYITLFLVGKLINAAHECTHLPQLQSLILKHLSTFLKELE